MNWRAAAGRVNLDTGDDARDQLGRFLAAKRPRLYAAFSGGADSLFALLWLVDFLSEARVDREPRLTALHFNHRLRGADSDADEAFAVAVCSGLGVPVCSESWDRPNPGAPVAEEEAREARLAFFARTAGKEQSHLVVTGHHADDVVETMLMRLSRGSGLQGLCAPRRFSRSQAGLRFFRPLLHLDRAEIERRLADAGVPWQVDRTNADPSFYRNRLRRDVVPPWKQAADRPLPQAVAASRRQLEEDWEAMEWVVDQLWRSAGAKDGSISLSRMQALPVALQRRLLHRLAAGAKLGLPASQMSVALFLIANSAGGRASLSPYAYLEIDAQNDLLRLRCIASEADWRAFILPLQCVAHFPDGATLSCAEIEVGPDLLEKARRGELSHDRLVLLCIPEKLRSGLAVRRWREGDAYTPMGRSTPVKIAKMQADRKWSIARRRSCPVVVAASGEILWAPGLPPCHRFRLRQQSCRALQLTYCESSS